MSLRKDFCMTQVPALRKDLLRDACFVVGKDLCATQVTSSSRNDLSFNLLDEGTVNAQRPFARLRLLFRRANPAFTSFARWFARDEDVVGLIFRQLFFVLVVIYSQTTVWSSYSARCVLSSNYLYFA